MNMKRDLVQLTNKLHDLLVIGGGIYGTCITWDATLRGLSVALVDKGDFGHATSANSLKTVHGGLRYLRHADLKRMRESIRERRTFMRIAPHLVHPLPCLMPTYGHGIKGREVMNAALVLNDLISFDRNRLKDPQKYLPRGRVISKRECLELLPHISEEGLTGGAIWYDGQMYNSERLTLSFVLSAANSGAMVANYVEVTDFMKEKDNVTGVEAIDLLTGDRFEIRAKIVVNTTGPWLDRVLGLLNGQRPQLEFRLAKAINLLTHRPLFQTCAVALSSKYNHHDTHAVINKGSPLLFISPWRGKSMVGTKYIAYNGDPNDFKITEEDIQTVLDEINQAYPPANLKWDDIAFVHGGLVPISGVDPMTGAVQRAKHYQIRDHRDDGLNGLISVLGVKYTTARDVAEKVVNLVFQLQGHKPPKSTSAVTPLHGGQIDRFEIFVKTEIEKQPYGLGAEMVRQLVYNYGSVYPDVLRYFEIYDDGQQLPEHLAILRAEILYGIHEEMAQKLTDVVLRRTELGTAEYPGDEVIKFCAEVMGRELGWGQAQIQQELQEVDLAYSTVKQGAINGGETLASTAFS